MQTFLPELTFADSAAKLDRLRLGKQRVETLQILNVLSGKRKTKGWLTHPAVIMWVGYEPALVRYGVAICREWLARGYKDTCLEKIRSVEPDWTSATVRIPPWYNEWLVQSHRSNLVRKDPTYYKKFWADIRDDYPYVWPGTLEQKTRLLERTTRKLNSYG